MKQLLESVPSLVTLSVTVCFVIFHYFFRSESIKHMFRGGVPIEVQRLSTYGQRVAGFFSLGVVPGIIAWCLGLSVSELGLGCGALDVSGGLVLAVLVIVLPVLKIQSRLPKALEEYPEIRALNWTIRDHLLNGATWCLYLVSYEFFFRGFLLFTLYSAFGLWPAICLSTVAYVFAHLDKPASETIGSIPIGLLFGWVALTSGTIWGPVIAHCIIAIANDLFCYQRRSS